MNARPSHRATRPRRTLRAAVVLGLAALVVSLTVQAGHSLSTPAAPVPAGDTAGTGTGPVEDRPRGVAAVPVPVVDPARKTTESVDLKG